MTDITERELVWYQVWQSISFSKNFLYSCCDGDPDTREIGKLLDAAQYFARLNTIIVDSETGACDASLVDPDKTLDPRFIDYAMQNPQEIEKMMDELIEQDEYPVEAT